MRLVVHISWLGQCVVGASLSINTRSAAIFLGFRRSFAIIISGQKWLQIIAQLNRLYLVHCSYKNVLHWFTVLFVECTSATPMIDETWMMTGGHPMTSSGYYHTIGRSYADSVAAIHHPWTYIWFSCFKRIACATSVKQLDTGASTSIWGRLVIRLHVSLHHCVCHCSGTWFCISKNTLTTRGSSVIIS